MRHYTSRVLERSRAESLTTGLLACLRAQHPVLPLYLLPTTLPQLVSLIPSVPSHVVWCCIIILVISTPAIGVILQMISQSRPPTRADGVLLDDECIYCRGYNELFDNKLSMMSQEEAHETLSHKMDAWSVRHSLT